MTEPTATDLHERLRRLEDLQEIQQLFVDYGRLLDRRDFAGYAALFAQDGEVLLGPMGRAKGPAAIRELMTAALGDAGPSFHVISSPDVRLDGDTATSEVMWTVITGATGDGPHSTSVGFHADELVREHGRWRFRRRRGHLNLAPAPA